MRSKLRWTAEIREFFQNLNSLAQRNVGFEIFNRAGDPANLVVGVIQWGESILQNITRVGQQNKWQHLQENTFILNYLKLKINVTFEWKSFLSPGSILIIIVSILRNFKILNERTQQLIPCTQLEIRNSIKIKFYVKSKLLLLKSIKYS